MKSTGHVWARTLTAGLSLLSLAVFLSAASPADEKHPFTVAGTFVDSCSCELLCPCVTGRETHMCQGVGAMSITSGTYQGVDLAGAKFAYATALGNWVRLYVDAKDAKQQEALSAFTRAAFAPFGKIEEVKKAAIAIAGSDGKYTINVDGGRIMSVTTEPVLGADQKTPFMLSNTLIPVSPTLMQGKTLKGSFNDGGHSFTIANSNTYFNAKAHNSGKI
jgi:hypothetical protein